MSERENVFFASVKFFSQETTQNHNTHSGNIRHTYTPKQQSHSQHFLPLFGGDDSSFYTSNFNTKLIWQQKSDLRARSSFSVRMSPSRSVWTTTFPPTSPRPAAARPPGVDGTGLGMKRVLMVRNNNRHLLMYNNFTDIKENSAR